MDRIKDIEKYGKEAQGKKDLIRHLQGERLTMKQAVLAMCFGCLGFYADGKKDCKMPDCPLYGFMPYRVNKVKKEKQERTQKQIEATQKLSLLRSNARSSSGLESTTSIHEGLDTPLKRKG